MEFGKNGHSSRKSAVLFIFKSDWFSFFFSLSFFFEGEESFLTGSFQGSEHLIGRRKVALDSVLGPVWRGRAPRDEWSPAPPVSSWQSLFSAQSPERQGEMTRDDQEMTRERWPSELGPWAGTQAAVSRTDTGSGFRVGGVCLPRWELRLLGGRFFSPSPPLKPGSHTYELCLDAVFLKFLNSPVRVSNKDRQSRGSFTVFPRRNNIKVSGEI